MNKNAFGNRILLFVSLLLVLPVLLTAYMMHIIKNSELSLLEHHKAKLNQAVYLFDQNMSEGLQQYLIEHHAENLSRQEKITILGEYVNKVINDVRIEYPDIHLGLYYGDLDVYYDGTRRFGENFSLRRKTAFEQTIKDKKIVTHNYGQDDAEEGLVEVYKPFTRQGKVEGVIRSADYLADTGFYKKRKTVETTAYTIIGLVIILGLGGAMFLIRQLVYQVAVITAGVRGLEDDITRTLPSAPGELGIIVEAVNKLSRKISDLNLYNEKMLASIMDAILVVDKEGRIMIANRMARKSFMLGEESINCKYAEELPAGSPFIELLRQVLNENRQFKDLPISWFNGQEQLELLVNTSALIDSAGNNIGAVLTSHDITERARLREKAARQERLASLGKLVAGVAHEIRNPLTSINMYIQHWQNLNKPNPKALATMHREVARLDSIVDQLLYFAKPAEAKFQEKNINSLINNLLNFFGEVHLGKYTLIKDLREDLPLVWIDEEQIERVIVNLLFNAIQAMGQSGTITVTTGFCPNTDTVKVSVADTGCGIPKENMAHLFDPFYSTRPKGTGLGLAIVHEIIQVHGGYIEVESEVGRGTRFTLYLKPRGDN